MPQIKNYIFALFVLLNISMSSQSSIENDPLIIQNNIDYRITEAKNNIDNYKYYEAQKNLDEALELATKQENTKSIGEIYSIKGRLQLTIEEEDEAIKSLNKAIEVQRFSKDNASLGSSYKTFGDVYLSKKDYAQALDYKTLSTIP